MPENGHGNGKFPAVRVFSASQRSWRSEGRKTPMVYDLATGPEWLVGFLPTEESEPQGEEEVLPLGIW